MTAATLAVLLAAAPSPPSAARPRVANARIVTHDAGAGLEATFRRILAAEAGPAWIGYAVPLRGTHRMCCGSFGDGDGRVCSGCALETGDAAAVPATGSVSLEDDRTLVVLFRAEGGRVERIRTASWSCGLDAGGRTLHWLSGVAPSPSLRLLAGLVGDGPAGGKRGENAALLAMALHDHPEADAVLDRFAADGQPLRTRKQAVFWMGVARGRSGYERLRRIAREDGTPALREHAVFALSQNDTPEAVDAMLEVARRDASPRVRGQAVFWLGQKAGRKAVEGIEAVMDGDPETEVRKKAVFALSQLPAGEGVPLLIRTARTHRDPQVRKQAIFWLGQSEDSRALEFFADVLARK